MNPNDLIGKLPDKIWSEEDCKRVEKSWNRWYSKRNLTITIHTIKWNYPRFIYIVQYTLLPDTAALSSVAPHTVELAERMLEEAGERILEWMIGEWFRHLLKPPYTSTHEDVDLEGK